MKRFLTALMGVVFIASLSAGCSKSLDGKARLKTYRSFGLVQVDGQPAEGLAIICYPDRDVSEQTLPSSAMTGAGGKFSFATYAEGDGLPEGAYTLAFVWKEMGLGETPDRLGGTYADPAKSKVQIFVGPTETSDLGVIELSTKSEK